MLNKSIICGHLVNEPKLYSTYCHINLEIIEEFQNRLGVNKMHSVFHPVTLGGRVAESFVTTARQGDLILIEGKHVMNFSVNSSGKEYRTFCQSFKIISTKDVDNIL